MTTLLGKKGSHAAQSLGYDPLLDMPQLKEDDLYDTDF